MRYFRLSASKVERTEDLLCKIALGFDKDNNLSEIRIVDEEWVSIDRCLVCGEPVPKCVEALNIPKENPHTYSRVNNACVERYDQERAKEEVVG